MDDGRGRMEWAEERESQSPTHLPTGWLVCAEGDERGVVEALLLRVPLRFYPASSVKCNGVLKMGCDS